MFYYLFEYLDRIYDFPGAGVFQYLTFRAAMAAVFSLIISMIIGKRIIAVLRRQQVKETIRDLGLEGQKAKQGTPTMGGLIILAGILVPVLLFARIDNIYIALMIITTIWLGIIGFIDDYIKVFKKHKEGLAGKFKIMGQIGLGIIVGCALFFSDDVRIRQNINGTVSDVAAGGIETIEKGEEPGTEQHWVDVSRTKTTIPFIKNNEFDYSWLVSFLGENKERWAYIVYLPIVILIITAVSNGSNLTDGLDGLAAGTCAIIGGVLAVFAYVSGNTIFADYLNIMYIPDIGELVIYIAAFTGSCIGFLWYNSYPAQVFMGDTGSLALGGIIAVFSLAVRKELLLPIICGVFLLENLSVLLQVGYFKYTKKRTGIGRRIFLMSPLHHHYQKSGMHESKIVTRFWIAGVLLAVLSVITLKLR